MNLQRLKKTDRALKGLFIVIKGCLTPSAQSQRLFTSDPRVPKMSCKFAVSRALAPLHNQSQHFVHHSAPWSCIQSESSATTQTETASSSHFLLPINSPSLISLYFIGQSSHPDALFPILPLCHLFAALFYLQFYFPGSLGYLPFPCVVKFSLPITTTLPLFAPSVFCPQGVLSQSEANLPNYKPHLLFLSLCLPSFLDRLLSFTDTQKLQQEKHLSSPNTSPLSFAFCHTVKKPITHTSTLLPSLSALSPFIPAIATLIWN